jgi:phosphoesterase RecJ-like protein
MADTGSFRYSSTTASTLEAGARLVRAGAVPNQVSQQLYARQSLTTIKLHAECLLNVKLFEQDSVSVLVVTKEMVERLGATPDDSEGLVERGRDIQGVKVSALMRWVDDLWRVSLRSRDPRWDVSTVAQAFGGGGHKAAAAFRWRRSQAELESLLIPKLCELARGA